MKSRILALNFMEVLKNLIRKARDFFTKNHQRIKEGILFFRVKKMW